MLKYSNICTEQVKHFCIGKLVNQLLVFGSTVQQKQMLLPSSHGRYVYMCTYCMYISIVTSLFSYRTIFYWYLIHKKNYTVNHIQYYEVSISLVVSISINVDAKDGSI